MSANEERTVVDTIMEVKSKFAPQIRLASIGFMAKPQSGKFQIEIILMSYLEFQKIKSFGEWIISTILLALDVSFGTKLMVSQVFQIAS